MLQWTGLYWPVLDYNTVSHRQKTLRVAMEGVPTTTARHSQHYWVDSTDIKMLGEGEWKTKKEWRKVPPRY